jgi:hypothetical protein
MQKGNANPEAQFFRISGGTPSGPRPLLLSNSKNAFSTSETVNGSEPKGGSSFTRSGPGLDGAHPNVDRFSKLMTDGYPSHFFLRSTYQKKTSFVSFDGILDANAIIIIVSTPMILLIFSHQCSKFVSQSFAVTIDDITVNHVPPFAFFDLYCSF